MRYETSINPDHFQFSLMSMDIEYESPEWDDESLSEKFAIAMSGIYVSMHSIYEADNRDIPIIEDSIPVIFTDIEPLSVDHDFMVVFVLRSENGLYELSSPNTTNYGEKINLGTDLIVRLYLAKDLSNFLFFVQQI